VFSMTGLGQDTREALKIVAASRPTGALFKRGLRNMFLQSEGILKTGLPTCQRRPTSRGRSLGGLFPVADDRAKADLEVWKRDQQEHR
jgi:hypothetical protein